MKKVRRERRRIKKATRETSGAAAKKGRTPSKRKEREPARRIEECIDQDEWKEARRLLRKELKKEPDSHWLLTRLSLTYYEEMQYLKALEISEEARTLAPRCPLVLWDYAGSLAMLGRRKEAIAIYKKLLRRGVESVAYGRCGEGLRWARSLLNDCRYRIFRCYNVDGNYAAAARWGQEHLANRAPGIPSLYKAADFKLDLAITLGLLEDQRSCP